MQWIAEHWLGITSLALMGGGVWWMMPRRTNLPNAVGLIAALAGRIFGCLSNSRALKARLKRRSCFLSSRLRRLRVPS